MFKSPPNKLCTHDSHMLIHESSLMRLHGSRTDCHYLSGMQSAQRTSCQPAAPSSCAPPPGAGFEAAPELLRAAAWPSPPSGPELSSGSVQTPAAGTYRSHHSGRPARLGAGSLCAAGGNGKRSKWKDQQTNQSLMSWDTESTPSFSSRFLLIRAKITIMQSLLTSINK